VPSNCQENGRIGIVRGTPAAVPTTPAPNTARPADSADATPRFMVDGNGLTMLPEGAARMAALLGLIDGAARTLRVVYYIYADDDAGGRSAPRWSGRRNVASRSR
jgi:phosphatidylserine/phosphatidylglycerophosphate/cardiolipin synthase-like enzyme